MKPGHVIAGKYVLGDVLGTGGMGVVHLAMQRSLDRTVAVKVPRAELAEDELVRDLFRREAVTGSRLDHRNLVRILDFGEDAGVPYVVMDHIAGPRLGQLIRAGGPLPLGPAVDLVRQVVAGLEDAHGSSIVHADVKSDNVLVQTLRDGSVVPRLIDFGIARAIDEPDRDLPARAVFVTGTPEYVAPEVARGHRLTPAADVYAIGVMLYEMVAGAAPFAGEPPRTIVARKLEVEAMPLARRCPELGVPYELDRLVSRMLARDPGERPRDARELGRCLDNVYLRDAGGLPQSWSAEPTSFSTEGLTQRMTIEQAPASASLAERRLAVLAAIKAGDANRIAAAYLALARALIDRRELRAAQAELEEGIELLMTTRGGPVWRLLLSLAALYAHHGDRVKARIVARAARDQAMEAGSSLGQARSERLFARIR